MNVKLTTQRRRYEITRAEARVLDVLDGAGPFELDRFLELVRAYEYSPQVSVVDHLEASRDVHFLVSGSARVSELP